MILPFPKWILEMPDGIEKERAIDAFFIKLGCIYASRSARIRVLADAIGINYSTLKSQVTDRRIIFVPPNTFDKIEGVMGIRVIEWSRRGVTFETEF